MPSRSNESLIALSRLLAFHGVEATLPHLDHDLAADLSTDQGIARLARDRGMETRIIKTSWSRLNLTPLPAIAVTRDGGAVLLCAVNDKEALIQSHDGLPNVLAESDFKERWTGQLVLGRRSGSTETRFGFGWFFQALKRYKTVTAQVLLASLAVQLLGLASPLVFQVIIDRVLVNRTEATLEVLGIALLLIAVFEFLLTGLRTSVINNTTSRIDIELGMKLFRHLIGLPLSYFHSRRVGVSVARVRELDGIRNFLTSSALTISIDTVFTVVFLVVMATYSTLLTVVVLLSLPLYVLVSLGVGPLFRSRVQDKFRTGAENQSFLVEAVTGIETIKSLAAEPHMQRRWEDGLAAYVSASLRVVDLGNWTGQLVQLISKLGGAAILFVGAGEVMHGKMTVGELIAFNMLAQRVAAPVLRLAQVWQDFHQAQLSVHRIGDIMNTPSERPEGSRAVLLPELRGDIVFDEVRFRYAADRPPVLNGLNLRVCEGECIGIVGTSGSGKSTIAKLMQGVQTAEAGRVTIGGLDVAAYDTGWLRMQVGVVQQESFLFNGTIVSNIAAARPRASLAEVMEAARLAGAHDFIAALPQGYQTEIGERGASLSGGQKQRIAIARTLLQNPRILIFDEATSALDYESEAAIQANMKRIREGRTVIVIAHRLSTVRDSDRIVAVEKGRVVEQGCHDELLRQDGRYASLYALQAGLRVVA